MWGHDQSILPLLLGAQGRGWLDRLRIAIVDYDRLLCASTLPILNGLRFLSAGMAVNCESCCGVTCRFFIAISFAF